jgi:hypothetical protein
MVAFLLVLMVTAAILLALVLSILRLNNNTFTYTLDDPYIGLAFTA